MKSDQNTCEFTYYISEVTATLQYRFERDSSMNLMNTLTRQEK